MYCMSYVRYVFLFFFKQKAAYERRISDWSSDVCSSDLGLWQKIQKINSDGYFLGCHYGLEAMKKRPNGSIVNMSSMAGIGGQSSFCAYRASKAAVDRKGVVSGKSVSGRVDLGGRRRINNNNTQTHTLNHQLDRKN